jgi:hypothetical protein
MVDNAACFLGIVMLSTLQELLRIPQSHDSRQLAEIVQANP